MGTFTRTVYLNTENTSLSVVSVWHILEDRGQFMDSFLVLFWPGSGSVLAWFRFFFTAALWHVHACSFIQEHFSLAALEQMDGPVLLFCSDSWLSSSSFRRLWKTKELVVLALAERETTNKSQTAGDDHHTFVQVFPLKCFQVLKRCETGAAGWSECVSVFWKCSWTSKHVTKF